MRVSSARWSLVAALAVLPVFAFELYAVPAAHADAKSKADIEAKIKAAMENYDLLEYEEARKLLNQALTVAKKAKMESEPITAKVHLSLGIVYFAGLGDAESAKLSFLNAVEIDPNVQIEKAYATPEMSKLLEDARAENPGGGGGGTDEPSGPTGPAPMDVDCGTVTGMQHTLVEEAAGGADLTLQAALGADVQAAKVAIMYRPRGASEFNEAPMTLGATCVYSGSIPASALSGDLVHYYIAAYNAGGKVIASKGSAGSPNIIEVSAATGGGGGGSFGVDDEDPLAGGSHGTEGNRGNRGNGGNSDTQIGGKVGGRGGKKHTMFLAVAGGSGAGYVTGNTEQGTTGGNAYEVKCCFAPSLLHLMPELGYYMSKTTTVSVAVRLGFPIGANIAGHSPVAPGGLLRVRHSLSGGGSGLMVVGGIGGGVLRNTIKLDNAPEGMDTDVVALGPLLVNAGAGYHASLGGGLGLVAELDALAGIPVVKELGGYPINFGVQFDFNLGLVLGF